MGIAALLIGLALARQEPLPPRHTVLGNIVLMVFTPVVRRELDVTDDQLDKIQKAFGDTLLFEKDRIVISLAHDEDLDELTNKARLALSPRQDRRLKELFVQQNGALVAADPEFARELALTEGQKTKAKAVLNDTAAKLNALAAKPGDADPKAETKRIRRAAIAEIEDALSTVQKEKLNRLRGLPLRG